MKINEVEKKLLKTFSNEKLKVIEYKNMKSPIKVQCLSCGVIYSL